MRLPENEVPRQKTSTEAPSADAVEFRAPRVPDGIRLWEIARDSAVLDLNSSYAYVLWCRDFARTSIVAVVDGRVHGFVTGYRRQDRPDTLMVWQVATDESQRGKGVAGRMLSGLLDRLAPDGVTRLETTISPDNTASQALFTGVARRRGVGIRQEDLFPADAFPDSHEPEDLYIIGDPADAP
ncbi:diaminobutyrate acetyltransferase [Tomitella gaofuii]|uniref:diaminobutyrate acetyltransferase n=1 Tax=Tomitella gaofuii TaxID=2760083 RepID=UPI0015FCBBCC|nr:diaminobutyrate acetyltransferase [Tomitella gaofuii]